MSTDIQQVRGVGPESSKALRSVGIASAELLAVSEPWVLCENTSLGEGICNKIIRAARELVGINAPESGLSVEERRDKDCLLSTGLERLDELLFGGIRSGSLVEFYGQARGGKSQWCSQLAVLALKGSDRPVIWYDSERSFSPRVIRHDALRFGLDPEETLGRTLVCEVFTLDHLNDQLEGLLKTVSEHSPSLMVIDSLGGLFTIEYITLDLEKHMNRMLLATLSSLRRTARMTGMTVIYTNQVFKEHSFYGGNPNCPMNGHVMSHMSDYRFYTRRRRQGEIKLDLKDNVSVPEFSLNAYLGYGGLYESRAALVDFEKSLVKSKDIFQTSPGRSKRW